jgi:hypothetical protein
MNYVLCYIMCSLIALYCVFSNCKRVHDNFERGFMTNFLKRVMTKLNIIP